MENTNYRFFLSSFFLHVMFINQFITLQPLFAQTPVDTVKLIFESDVLLEQVSSTPHLVLLGSTGDTLTNRQVFWSSQNTSIATVNSVGLVSAIAAGKTNIFATVEGKTGQAAINVESRSMYEGHNAAYLYNSNDTRQPIWDPIRQGQVPNPNDNRQQIVIDESFQVPPGTEVKWENKIVWIRPKQRKNINIYGKLNISNSSLFWDQTEHQQTRLDVQNGGILRIVNSHVGSCNIFWINWEYENGSTIYFNHFQGNAWTSMRGSVNYTSINGSTAELTIFQDVINSTIYISDSSNLWLEVFPPPGTVQMSFPALNIWTDWQLSGIWPNTNVMTTNSYLYGRGISLSNGVHATIKDTPIGFGVGWTMTKFDPGFADCELNNIGDPNNDSGVFYANNTWSVPGTNSSLTVINSKLLRIWPALLGNIHLKIYSSNLVDPSVFGPATFEVYNSTIDLIRALGTGARVYFENCMLRYDIQVNGTNSIVYSYGLTQRDDKMFNIFQENSGKYIVLQNPKSGTDAANIIMDSGNSQTGFVGDTLARPLIVTITDTLGFPVHGTTVTFANTSTYVNGSSLTRSTVISDLNGKASSNFILGSLPGSYYVSATAQGLKGSPINFQVTAKSKPSGVETNSDQLPQEYILYEAYPNPFNPKTKLRFGLPERTIAKLVVYDIIGREVSTLVNQELEAGYHEINFDGSKLSSGAYFYRISIPKFNSVKKMMLMK